MAPLFAYWRLALLALLTAFVLPAAAQDDPPGRVGRIADLQGQVWLYDLVTADWVAAGRNRPLTTGDRVATDGDGRAELRIGSTTIRLGAGTEIDLLQLDDERMRVQLVAGQLAVRLRAHETAREFEIVTEEGSFAPEHAGRYRFDRADAVSSVTVASGQLVFRAPDFSATVIAGQRADIVRPSGQTQYVLVQPRRDAFADEVAAAEAAAERTVSTRYVSPEMTGAEALDTWGRWENDVEHGALWVPRAVVPGWAPYRYGHWAWIRPWGWTWVDDAPWGFAPFHYGRWVFWRNAWCWAPGRWVARPVYAPALVAWVGSPGVAVSVNVGPSVGWFPLGPREVFVPAYRVTPHYVRNVNVTHVTNITNVTQIVNSPNTVVQQTNYVNRGVAGAVTVVPASVVAGRQPVAPARVQLTDPKPGQADGRRLALTAQAPVTAAPPIAAPAVAAVPAAASPRPPKASVAASPPVTAPRVADPPATPQPLPQPQPQSQTTPKPQPQPQTTPQPQPQPQPKFASPPAVPVPLPTPKPNGPGVGSAPPPVVLPPPAKVSVPPGGPAAPPTQVKPPPRSMPAPVPAPGAMPPQPAQPAPGSKPAPPVPGAAPAPATPGQPPAARGEPPKPQPRPAVPPPRTIDEPGEKGNPKNAYR